MLTRQDIRAAAYVTDVREAAELVLANKGINDLGCIAEASNLTSLNLAFNGITNISPVTALVSLRSLNFSHNKLSTLCRGLSNLQQLTCLKVNSNHLNSFSGLEECAQLSELWAQNNQIVCFQDLQPLSHVPKLTRLCISPNPVTKLVTHEQLRKHLAAQCCNLKVLDAVPVTDQERQQGQDLDLSALDGAGVKYSCKNSAAAAVLVGSRGPLRSAPVSGVGALPSRGDPDSRAGIHTSTSTRSFGAHRNSSSPSYENSCQAQPHDRSSGSGILQAVTAALPVFEKSATGTSFAGRKSSSTVSMSPLNTRTLRKVASSDQVVGTRPPEGGGGAAAALNSANGLTHRWSHQQQQQQRQDNIMDGVLSRDDFPMLDTASVAGSSATASTTTPRSMASSSTHMQSRPRGRPPPGLLPRVKDLPQDSKFQQVLATLPTLDRARLPPSYQPRDLAKDRPKKPAPVPPPPEANITVYELRYPHGARGQAVRVCKDGSATVTWPSGSVAISVDADYSSSTAPSSAAQQMQRTTPSHKQSSSSPQTALVSSPGGPLTSDVDDCAELSDDGDDNNNAVEGRNQDTREGTSQDVRGLECATQPAVAQTATAPSVYRMLALYRGSGSVAVSWDTSTGGFVQYPSGALCLVVNTVERTGTLFGSSGDTVLKWPARSSLPPSIALLQAHLQSAIATTTTSNGNTAPSSSGSASKHDDYVDVVLDSHLAIRFVRKTQVLQLYCACQGVQYMAICGCNGPGWVWDINKDGDCIWGTDYAVMPADTEPEPEFLTHLSSTGSERLGSGPKKTSHTTTHTATTAVAPVDAPVSMSSISSALDALNSSLLSKT